MIKSVVSNEMEMNSMKSSSTMQPTSPRGRKREVQATDGPLPESSSLKSTNSGKREASEVRDSAKESFPSATLPRLHNLESVAQRVGLSRSAIYREIGAGKLKIVKIGRAVRVTESEIARYIDSLPIANG